MNDRVDYWCTFAGTAVAVVLIAVITVGGVLGWWG